MIMPSSGANSVAPSPRRADCGMRSPMMSRSIESATYSAARALLRRSAGGRKPPMASVLVAAQDDFFEVLDLFEDLPRSEHHAGERVGRDANVEVRDLAQQQIETAQQR